MRASAVKHTGCKISKKALGRELDHVLPNALSSLHNASTLVALGKMHVEFKTQAPLSNHCSDPTTWACPAEMLKEADMQAKSCFAAY